MVRSVRPGEIDDFDAVDEIQSLVGCGPIDIDEAERLLPLVKWTRTHASNVIEIREVSGKKIVVPKVPAAAIKSTEEALAKAGFKDWIVESVY